MKQLKTIAAAAAAATVALGALPASAVTTDWGLHDAFEIGADKVPAGAIDDTFEFSLVDPASLTATAVSNNLGEGFHIESGEVSLYKVEAGPDTLVGSFAFDGTTGSTPHSFASLLSGDYFYRVAGDATGNAGGWYALASAVAAVPETNIGALMAAGLCVLMLVSRRRQLSAERRRHVLCRQA